jgi:hypothetical protein
MAEVEAIQSNASTTYYDVEYGTYIDERPEIIGFDR